MYLGDHFVLLVCSASILILLLFAMFVLICGSTKQKKPGALAILLTISFLLLLIVVLLVPVGKYPKNGKCIKRGGLWEMYMENGIVVKKARPRSVMTFKNTLSNRILQYVLLYMDLVSNKRKQTLKSKTLAKVLGNPSMKEYRQEYVPHPYDNSDLKTHLEDLNEELKENNWHLMDLHSDNVGIAEDGTVKCFDCFILTKLEKTLVGAKHIPILSNIWFNVDWNRSEKINK